MDRLELCSYLDLELEDERGCAPRSPHGSPRAPMHGFRLGVTTTIAQAAWLQSGATMPALRPPWCEGRLNVLCHKQFNA